MSAYPIYKLICTKWILKDRVDIFCGLELTMQTAIYSEEFLKLIAKVLRLV